MGQHQKYVKDLEPDGGHGEEVDRNQLLGMVLQEGAPSLRRRFAAAHHIFADTALSDVDAEFEKFAVDPWCTRTGILPRHLANQLSDFARNDASSSFSATHLPGPEQTKGRTMPGADRLWRADGQRPAPIAPAAR